MTFDEYQIQALTTSVRNDDAQMDATIWVLGIAGEAGEITEKWKKIVAYREGKITPEDTADFQKEIGDVLWYLAVFADRLGLSMSDIASSNLKKLADRQQRDVIKGAGDDR